jgi:glycosyltransferase involved in cell wall biosynthesis
MRRIVIFAPHYAEYATRLAIAMSQKAHVLLILDRRNAQNECDPRLMARAKSCLKIIEFGSFGRKERIAALVEIISKIIAFRPHLVNIQEEEGTFAIWVTRIIARLYKTILTVHDPMPHSGTDLEYVTQNLTNRAITRQLVTSFHVHGHYCYTQLVNQIGQDRPILNGVHGVILVPESYELCVAEPGRILMFGRMEAYKGLEVLLNAADILRERGVKFKLIFAGRGPELERLSLRLAQHCDIHIIKQFLTPREAIEQFQKASFVVLPYLNATQSGVLAASFANSRPVIASNTGGLAEIVEHGKTGLIVPPNNAVALSDACEKLLNDNILLQKFSRSANDAAKLELNWSKIADQFLEFCKAQILQPRILLRRRN